MMVIKILFLGSFLFVTFSPYTFAVINGEEEKQEETSSQKRKVMDTEEIASTSTKKAKIKPHVLLVEDSRQTQMAYRNLLERSSFQVTLASHGGEAVEKILCTRFDLVLMDQEMPILNGTEAAQIIRSFPEYKDLIIISVTSRHDLKEKILEAGVNDIIIKPLTKKHITHVIKTYLEKTNDSPDSEENTTSPAKKIKREEPSAFPAE